VLTSISSGFFFVSLCFCYENRDAVETPIACRAARIA
jgi:hypothetical protein